MSMSPVAAAEQSFWQRVQTALAAPVRVVVGGFLVAIAIGTGILMLPISSETGEWTSWLVALFTTTSAVCVTGLAVVDTPTHWSTFGEVTIAVLIQIGGLGVMTLASLIVVLIGGRVGVRTSMLSEAEARGDGSSVAPRDVAKGVLVTSLIFEAIAAVVLAGRFWLTYDESFGRALYLGVFHAVSAFNNAGFGLWSDNLVPFVTDPWVNFPVALSVIVGGIGFPVLWELRRRWRRPGHWSLHTRVTLMWSAVLLLGGTAALAVLEWHSPATLGPLDTRGKLLASFFHSTVSRTAGFNTIPIGGLKHESLFVTDVLMFIGGGSAGTAGGIKVTTFILLGYVMFAELRGEPGVSVWRRRLPPEVTRQALTVALSGVGAVFLGTLALQMISHLGTDELMFEVISASGTVGLSTGITASLPPAGQLILVALMFLGRVGPNTLGAALALRNRPRRYSYPEERPIVG